jgi:hypothetical protein
VRRLLLPLAAVTGLAAVSTVVAYSLHTAPPPEEDRRTTYRYWKGLCAGWTPQPPPADRRALEELLGSREWMVEGGDGLWSFLSLKNGKALQNRADCVATYRVADLGGRPCLFLRPTDTPGVFAGLPQGEMGLVPFVFTKRDGDGIGDTRIELIGRAVGGGFDPKRWQDLDTREASWGTDRPPTAAVVLEF